MGVSEWRTEVGARIRGLRQQAPYHYTRKDLVLALKRMYALSITESQIEKIERGQSFPGYELLRVYRDHFETSYDYILGDRSQEFPRLSIYPELRELWRTARAAGIDEPAVIARLREAARMLIEHTYSIEPALRPTRDEKPRQSSRGRRKDS